MEVITEVANNSWAEMVLMSAWMPAPPLGSEPAMVSTVETCFMKSNAFNQNPAHRGYGRADGWSQKWVF